MTAMVRLELLREVVGMAFETLRANKLRSGLTIVGVVIGVTAVVGMTSLVRGFDQSLQAILQSIGPTTLYVAKFSGMSFMSGKSFLDLLKRPNLSREDARAIEKLDGIVAHVDVMYGGGFRPQLERIAYGRESTKSMVVIGASESFAEVNRISMAMGRSFTETEVNHRRSVVILGDAPYRALFRHVDPLGKQVRI
ncbi:MAG TPA: ABC transporter permease, partial [Vicinamibacteria bacterium]